MTKYNLTGIRKKARALRKGDVISVTGTRQTASEIMEILPAYKKINVRLDNGDTASYNAIDMIQVYEVTDG